MSNDFDIGRQSRRRTREDRTFKLHGEYFTVRSGVRPESLAGFDGFNDDASIAESMGAVDQMFRLMVEPDELAHERYDTIRADEVDPLTVEDLREVVEWMLEVATGRPTGSPSASTDGPKVSGTPLTDVSSSPETAAA